MEAYVIEWLSLLGRWLHMVVGIAWIGASLYFVWLDNHLLKPANSADGEKGVGGELWAVHGGGFYHAQKYTVAPASLPGTLHWFKWEAYWTWMSGVFLLGLIYWYGAEIYLIDPQVAALSKPVAVGIGVGVLLLGWVGYDLLCRSALGNNEKALSAVLFVLLTVAAWGLCQLFSGRGAYIHYGALIGTMMVGNVRFVIMPGQQALVAATEKGERPDPAHGQRAKQRSVHNTYLTLPVLFVMISNHYAMTFGSEWNWLILMALTAAGALIRVYFVSRHNAAERGTKPSLMPVGVSVAILAAVAAAMAPTATTGGASAPNLAEVRGIVVERCASCHAAQPTQPGFTVAPKGLHLETDEHILTNAAAIYQQTVVAKVMPVGNLTGITDEERAAIGAWYLSGQNAGAKGG